MAATRLRSMDWHRSLRQVQQRGGSLDIAIATDESVGCAGEVNVLWRVRLLEVAPDALLVEQPTTLGEAVQLDPDVEMVVIFAIGQNRWMFRTQNRGLTRLPAGGGRYRSRPTTALRLALPESVERCQRRTSYRVSTASLKLPNVDMWPLLDPKTVLVAERANELQFESGEDHSAGGDDLRLPEVGPRFSAHLLNLGGGGVGLEVPASESQSLLRHKLFWLRVALPPDVGIPVCATAKLVHTHMQASQNYYAGLAFDFTFNPGHQKFVVEQIGRYVAFIQRQQMIKRSA